MHDAWSGDQRHEARPPLFPQGQVYGLMVGSDCIAQRLIMLLLLCEGDEGVLDVLQGGQYGLLIRDEGLVAEGLLTETMAPPWKTGHVAAGPMKRERLLPCNHVGNRLLCQFTPPVRENWGKSCATATPICVQHGDCARAHRIGLRKKMPGTASSS